MTDHTGTARRELRRTLRKRRRALAPRQRKAAGRAVANRLSRLPEYRHARWIAIYLAFDGELPLQYAIRGAQRHGKRIVAPRLNRRGRLEFLPLAIKPRLRWNNLGIAEPVGARPIALRRLDLVLAPLVAFDSRGTRLGMGGGHYDRCFHFLNPRRRWRRTKFIGIGYDFQQTENLQAEHWDVPLWAAVTDRNTYRFPP